MSARPWSRCPYCAGARMEVRTATPGRFLQCQACVGLWRVDENPDGYFLTPMIGEPPQAVV